MRRESPDRPMRALLLSFQSRSVGSLIPARKTAAYASGCCIKPSAKTCAVHAVLALADAQGPDISTVASRPSDESHDFRPHP